MDRFRAMEVFVSVADRGGFSAAARDLQLSKGQVSRLIAALEDHIGVRLLQRSTRTVTLTPEGSRYLAFARETLEGVQRVEADLSHGGLAPKGHLRINAPQSYGERFVAPLMPHFMQLYPDVLVDLMLTDRYVDLVEEGFDVAVRVGGGSQSNLIARRIGTLRHGLFASPDYIKSHPALNEAADLTDHRCLVYRQSGALSPWSIRGQRIVPEPVMISNNGDVLRHAAVAGEGLVMLPYFFVEDDLAKGRLLDLMSDCPPEDPAFSPALMAVYPERRNLSQKVRVFIDFLAENLKVGAEGPKGVTHQ